MVDSDRIAREVVEAGTPGLAAIRERFGAGVVTAEGVLDRAALGAIVFADPDSRRALEAITHPLIRTRTMELVEAAPPGTIVVHDIPLLVEIGAAPSYHLVVVVDVDAEERVRRLVTSRGMAEADARSRVANQASRQERLAAADVVVDNNGAPDALVPQVDRLWQRLAEFEERLRSGDPATGPAPVMPPDLTWPLQADRAIARLAHRLTPVLGRPPVLEHVGPTAVAGLPAPDVLHLQVGLASSEDLDRQDVRTALEHLGHPRASAEDDGFLQGERVHLWCDPGRAVVVHLCVAGADRWRGALLVRDWLRADAGARRELEQDVWGTEGGAPGPVGRPSGHDAADRGACLSARDPNDGFPADWWHSAATRAEAWAASTGWQAPR